MRFGSVGDPDLGAYEVDSCQARKAEAILTSEPPEPVFPNPHPDAQWFKTAKRGTMLHWGIHSVDTLEPSWAMMRNTWFVSSPLAKEDYYALAERFNPCDYDPEKWAVAWKKAGMVYAILTTKHHDGYALWPTKYGDMNTRVYMNGRDLVRPFMEACRRHGIKVGLYFSQPDWHYPGYRATAGALVNGQWEHGAKPPPLPPEENQRRFQRYYAYIIAQLEELLTGYGKIDLLWFDGQIWLDAGNGDIPARTLAWVRGLHPGIVINERFGKIGDFISYEIKKPKAPPASWWEHVDQFGYGAGWGASTKFGTVEQLAATTNEMNVQGGNYTPNVSPMADGTFHPDFYTLCEETVASQRA